jgi:nucleotide-binding universal stress UspA family protein
LSGTKEFGKILVAVDTSPGAQRAARVAVELAWKYGAELTILHIAEMQMSPYVLPSESIPDKPVEIDVNRVYLGPKTEEEKAISSVATLAKTQGVSTVEKIIRQMGSAAEGITDYAEKNGIDLIVVGTRGMEGVKRLVFGSVASGVVSHAKCSVLVVR